MKLKLKFHGPNTVADVTRQQPLQIGHAISFETELVRDSEPTLNDMRRIWELERTFNELTKGRLHVEILEK